MDRKNRCWAILVLAVVAGLTLTGLSRSYSALPIGAQEGPSGQPSGKGGGEDAHAQDIAAIKKSMKSFLAAFEKGDAKTVAAHCTPQGEYIADDGTKYQGHKELEKVYTEFFNKNKNLKVAAEMESLRFPSSHTAVEEGYMKLRQGKGGDFTTSKYSVLHVKEDGKWLMAIVREWPNEGLSLHDIEWLIGSWTAKRDGLEVRTTYEWAAGKKFIVANFTIKDNGRTLKGKQRIAVDASTGLLRSWTFEEDGGFGEADWVRDGKKWVLDASGVTAEGAKLTATNLMTPLGEDTFLWHSVERTVDGESVPDSAPVKVTRVKAAK